MFFGEEGGVKLMVKEGVFLDNGVDVIFGLYINFKIEVGYVNYKFGGILVVVNWLVIKVKGK